MHAEMHALRHQFWRLMGSIFFILGLIVGAQSQGNQPWISPTYANKSEFGINSMRSFYQSEQNSNPFLRVIASQNQCRLGAMMTVQTGKELHIGGSDSNYIFLDNDLNCRTPCSFGHSNSGGAWTCKAADRADPADYLNCNCQECPCNSGLKGFRCSLCENDGACQGGKKCQKSLLPAMSQSKPAQCEITEKTGALYKTFWSSGLSHPQFLLFSDPVSGTVTVDIIQNLCTKLNPVLTQCTCTGCRVVQDTINPMTNARNGPCEKKGVPNPCWHCPKCKCDVPQDSFSFGTLSGVLFGGISRGVYLSCEAGSQGKSTCTGIFDDVPVMLKMTCDTGYCSDKAQDVFVASVGDVFEKWTVIAVILTAVAYVCALLALLDFMVWRRRVRFFASKALETPPPGHNQALQLSWSKITCVRGTRRVIDQASGELQCPVGQGLFVAIEGGSGSGKTTLLEVLGGRWSRGTTGTVSLNGVSQKPDSLRKIVGFVPQSETLAPLLTVREVIEFSASLRLRHLSHSERAGRVSWVLTRLGLLSVASSQIGSGSRRGVSGGEKKRAAIGVELVVASHVLVLDEPTTGLDAATALAMTRLLAGLAADGRVVICSLHQPRHEIRALFHKRLEMSNGVLTAASTEELSSHMLHELSAKNTTDGSTTENIDTVYNSESDSEISAEGDGCEAELDEVLAHVAPQVLPLPAGPNDDKYVPMQAMRTSSWPMQVLTLWRRSFTEVGRGSRRDLIAGLISLFVGCCCGLVFRDMGNGWKDVLNRFGIMFFIQTLFAYNGLEICSTWHSDRARCDYETHAKYYSGSAYFVAKASAHLFWYSMALPLFFTLPSYFSIGLSSNDAGKVVFFYLCVCGTAASASGICLFVMSMFASLASATACCASVITILLMYAGFLRPRQAMPATLKWIAHVSPFAHSLEALVSNELAGLTTNFDADGFDTVSVHGSVWLWQLDMKADDPSRNAKILGAIVVVCWALAMVAFVLRLLFGPNASSIRCARESRPSESNHFHSNGHIHGHGNSHSHIAAHDGHKEQHASAHKDPDVLAEETQVLETPLSFMKWEHVHMELSPGKNLLTDLLGHAVAKRPLALMGPSGAGKSTLLGVLAGDPRCSRATGTIAVDGAQLKTAERRQLVGFLHQDDALHNKLTVGEVMAFAAALRLPNVSSKEREQRVALIQQKLGLEDLANKRLGSSGRDRGLSGGERRRTAIGAELVAARPLLLLDEPLSGLDVASAIRVLKLIQDVAKGGRVVLFSLHQPSPRLLPFLHDCAVLAKGGVLAYQGPFEQLTSHCLELCLNPKIARVSATDAIMDALASDNNKVAENFRKSKSRDDMLIDRDRCVMQSEDTVFSSRVPHQAPLHVQLRVLVMRELRLTFRDTSLAPSHYLLAIGTALVFGFTYFNMPRNLEGILSRLGLFFSLNCVLGVQALLGLMAWRDVHTAFIRERTGGLYYTSSFVAAKVWVDVLILRLVPAIILGLVLYPIAGLAGGRQAKFLLTLCLASSAASSCCLCLGSVAPHSAVLLPVAIICILVLLLFGSSMMNSAQTLKTCSFFGASYHIMGANELHDTVFQFDPQGFDGASFSALTGEQWMKLLAIDDNLAVHVMVMLMWIVIPMVLMAFSLQCAWKFRT